MTPRMRTFLREAARAEPGKGVMVGRYDAHIATKAVKDGYGMLIVSPLKIFVIEKAGREALAHG